MSIELTAPKVTAHDGSIIGVIAQGKYSLESPHAQRIGVEDALPKAIGNYILDHTLAKLDAVAKAEAVAALIGLRRGGAAIILISHDELLLESCSDEIWWIRDRALIAQGDPAEVLTRYRKYVAETLRARAEGQVAPFSPTMRKGDGRALLERIELLGENGAPATVWRSGEPVSIRVAVRFMSAVEQPVVGIMIRTRIGLNVYGTNTELEQLKPGPVGPGDILRVTYAFRCDLSPGEYTVTAASHDPDGLWHDWMEDAVAFSVTDSRYTAGVANLRARVEIEQYR